MGDLPKGAGCSGSNFMTEKGQMIEHDDGSADIIWYDESPSGYPRPRVMQLTKRGYDKYKRDR